MTYRLLALPAEGSDDDPEVVARKSTIWWRTALTLVGRAAESSPSLDDYPACDREVKTCSPRAMWGDCDGKA
jgi:hypothetical protein